jgi:hypothetical protein
MEAIRQTPEQQSVFFLVFKYRIIHVPDLSVVFILPFPDNTGEKANRNRNKYYCNKVIKPGRKYSRFNFFKQLINKDDNA